MTRRLGALSIPDNAEVIFSGSSATVDIPLEAGIYYVKVTGSSPDFWAVAQINPEFFNESNVRASFFGHARAATQFLGCYWCHCTKLNDTTMRFTGQVSQINFGTPTNTTRLITRVLKAV